MGASDKLGAYPKSQSYGPWDLTATIFAALGIDPADAAPDYWRHVHNRLSAGLEPRGYTAAQHRAWLLRQACPPDPLTLRAASAGSVS